MLHVRRITALDDMAPLADDWNRLAGDVPFRCYPWHAGWWRNYAGPGRELYVLEVRDAQGNVVAIAPWFLELTAARGRVLAWLGSGKVSSDYQSLMVSEEHAEAAAEAIAAWLAAAGDDGQSGPWDLLHLDGVDAADKPMGELISQLWSSGCSVRREAAPSCWRIALPGSWEEYVEGLSKSHRKQIRRLQRRQLETGRAWLHTAGCDDTLAQGMGILAQLHEQRRESLGEASCFADSRFAGFLHDVARDMLTAGRLRLHWLTIENRPAAAELHLVGDGVTYAYQAGIDPELLHEEPGRLITIATIQQAIAAGQTGFDLLRGDEPYKAHWRAEPRPSIVYRIVPRAAGAQIRHGVWLAGEGVKRWVKTGLKLTGMR